MTELSSQSILARERIDMKKKQGGKQLDVETFVLSKSSMVPDYYPVENAQEYSSDGPEEK